MRAIAIVLLACLASCVVIRPPRRDERPRWRLAPEAKQAEASCVSVRPLVRRSGKAGVGIALQLKSRSDCAIQFTTAHLAFAGGTTIAVTVPSASTLPGRSLVYVWWPIYFDNNAAWNAGRNRADLHLAYSIAGSQGEWTFPMEQR